VKKVEMQLSVRTFTFSFVSCRRKKARGKMQTGYTAATKQAKEEGKLAVWIFLAQQHPVHVFSNDALQ
jgi:hypothetical protein